MDMDMDMGSSSSSSQDSMTSMVLKFTSSTTTPLYSDALSPGSAGAYAGNCIFLVVLAVSTRLLWAFKATLEKRWLDKDRRRRYVVVRNEPTEAQNIMSNADSKEGKLITARGAEENIKILATSVRPVTAWRLSVDLPRALLNTAITGLAYLLMLAVMTMNLGYFCSVLGGVFIGDLAVGRFGSTGEH